MITNHLLILFSSIHPVFIKEEAYYKTELEFLVALKSILHLNLGIEFIFYDNSINSIEEVKNIELKELLFQQIEGYPVFIEKFRFKKVSFENTSIGYLKLLQNFDTDFKYLTKTKSFTFFSLRRIITSPYYFITLEKLLNSKFEGLTISNMNINLSSGVISSLSSSSIDDSLFSLSSENVQLFLNYINTLDFKEISKSEEVLQEFLQDNHVLHTTISNVGLIKNHNYHNYDEMNHNLILY